MQDEIGNLFSKGDMNALSKLVEMHKNELYNFCFRLCSFNAPDADDLFQQTWVKAVKSATRYQHKAFKSWLFQICLNQYRDNYRQRVRQKNLMKDDFGSTSIKDYVLMNVSGVESVEEQYERRHIQTILVENIDRLPKEQKIPMLLFYYQNLKYTEIADILRIPEGTVKSRINTAKRKLKSVLEREIHV